MLRALEPEILDHLDAVHPDAVRSRRELSFINAIMGNHRWMLRMLREQLGETGAVLELGSGDGAFARSLIDGGVCSAERVHAIDFMPPPVGWPDDAKWICGSIFDEEWPAADVVIANLFLHHFSTEQLREIGDRTRRSRVVIACEPARRSLHIVQGAMLASLAGFNHVTRHDMRVSIRAGFLSTELPDFLGLAGWNCSVSTTLLGAYRLVALNPASA